MKFKKSIILFSFLTLLSIFIANPERVAADEFVIELPAGNFITMSGPMENTDYLYWNFTSTLADIMVMMLNNYEYDNYMDYDILSYTALLSNDKRSDSGWWRPPYTDIWHLIFENVGGYSTHLVCNGEIDQEYFSKDILIRDLIVGYIGFFMVVGIGSITLGIQHFKLKRV